MAVLAAGTVSARGTGPVGIAMSVLPSLMLIAGDEQSDGEGEKNFHGGVHAMKRKRRDRRTHIGCLRLPSKNAARSRLFGACCAGGLGHEILKLRCDRSLTRKLLLSPQITPLGFTSQHWISGRRTVTSKLENFVS